MKQCSRVVRHLAGIIYASQLYTTSRGGELVFQFDLTPPPYGSLSILIQSLLIHKRYELSCIIARINHKSSRCLDYNQSTLHIVWFWNERKAIDDMNWHCKFEMLTLCAAKVEEEEEQQQKFLTEIHLILWKMVTISEMQDWRYVLKMGGRSYTMIIRLKCQEWWYKCNVKVRESHK